jgi:hypothetical protein
VYKRQCLNPPGVQTKNLRNKVGFAWFGVCPWRPPQLYVLLGFNHLLDAFPKRCNRVNAKKEVDVIRAKRALIELKSNDGKQRFPSPKPEVRDIKEEAH